MIYVNEVRKALLKINYCGNPVTHEGMSAKCEVEHMCQQCQEILVNILQWADIDDDNPTPVEGPSA